MKNTDNLKSDLNQLEADSSELENKVKAVDDDLIYVHDKLSISETIHDRLSTLDSSLKLASDLLGVVRIIPAITAPASNTKRVIDLFREPVSKAKKVSGDIDKRVKPIRTKVHQVEKDHTYIFRGNVFWLYSQAQDDAQGPFAIADEFGKDDHGQPLTGPFDAACAVDDSLYLFQGEHYYICTPDKKTTCQGPMPIEGDWGKTAGGQPLSGPFNSAFSLNERVYLFQKNQFYIATKGTDKTEGGPHPIKGYWGINEKGAPLDGPFDAVTVHADRLYIRKGKLVWDQQLDRIKALSEQID